MMKTRLADLTLRTLIITPQRDHHCCLSSGLLGHLGRSKLADVVRIHSKEVQRFRLLAV